MNTLTKNEREILRDLVQLEIDNSKVDIEHTEITEDTPESVREWYDDHIKWQGVLQNLLSKLES